jgi:hypothetical protein
MKKADVTLKEYVKQLSDDSLYFLSVRFSQVLCGDRAEIADFLSTNRMMDNWLSGAISAEEWFNMVDSIGDYVKKEISKRGSSEKV